MVGKIKLAYTSHVISYLDDLVRVLYKNDYFGFIETAEEYVLNIYDFVSGNIKSSQHRITPKRIQYLGSNYIFYKVNKRTTWFIFFERQNENFLITGILNNHCEDANVL